jgi:methionyl-tRNA formyltransferase
MRIVFMGTPEFSVPSLDALVRNGYEVVLAVMQKDKPRDRGKEVKLPAVKEYALAAGIPVLQPERLSREPDMVEAIRQAKPDLIVTCAFGQLLPKSVLDIPGRGTINVHASLLPALRGAAPIQWAIINGERETGITTMHTDIGLDTGDMLLKETVEIPSDMTAGELHDMLSVIGAATLIKTLHALEAGTLRGSRQDESRATNAPRLTKEMGRIDWKKTSWDIHNLVRGTDPWPGAFTAFRGGAMRIVRTEPVSQNAEDPVLSSMPAALPGTILSSGPSGLTVQTGHGTLRVLEIQMPSSRKMSVSEYLNGHSIEIGTVLGDIE